MSQDAPSERQQVSQAVDTSKDVPWYLDDLEEVPEPFRELLEQYGGLAPERVKEHLLQVVRGSSIHLIPARAWEIWPYPCIGLFHFLDLAAAESPVYPSVLARLQSSSSSMADDDVEHEMFLDIGCCVGQTVRKVIYDGASPEHVWGLDIFDGFIQVGYELFRDRDRLESRFVVGDFLDTNPAGEVEQKIRGKVDIIYAGSFIHLFDYEGQVKACRRLMEMLRPPKQRTSTQHDSDAGRPNDMDTRTKTDKKGALIFGRLVGNLTHPGESKHNSCPTGTMYRHSPESFRRMWTSVAEESDTRWDIQIETQHIPTPEGRSTAGLPDDDDLRRLVFVLERIET